MTCSTLLVANGTYSLFDGIFISSAEARIAGLSDNSAVFIQRGGTHIGNVTVGNNINFLARGEYKILDGLVRAGEIHFLGYGRFIQSGGEVNSISNIVNGPGPSYPNGSYALSNGMLRVGTWDFVNGHCDQYGGDHVVTNGLAFTGYYKDDHGVIFSRSTAYFLSGG